MKSTETSQALIKQVETAFADVQLEDGIGLRKGQGLDDYEDTWTCQKYREEDEKDDWRKIPVEKLDQCYSSLSLRTNQK